MRYIVNNFCKITPCLALQYYCNNKEFYLRTINPIARLRSASATETPKLISSSAWANSGPAGRQNYQTATFMPLVNAWPARSDRAINASASGNCFSNCFSLLFS